VRRFAQTGRRNTDDLPLLEFHAPRQLFTDTRDLNLDLLYENKGGLVPPGAEIPDPEATYYGMVEPFIAMDRTNLANQAMAFLAGLERNEEATLHLAIAQLNLDSSSLSNAQDSLAKADEFAKEGSPFYAEKEEMWAKLYDSMGNTDEAALHFVRAAVADPSRPLPLRKLAEISAHDQNWRGAQRWMRSFIETKPNGVAHYWAMLGDYYLADENVDEALTALKTAIELDPYSYWARYRMARAFELRDDTENAIEQYEFLLKYAFDRDAEIYVKLATIYKNAHRPDDALRVLKKGHRLFPTNVPIYRLYEEIRGAE
ncbi:MAG: tetratricopeptide repeat protein, partial [Acidobacteria bacterium]|nr:tetratricopeptide repeat protein [Acidobacteriota bacterium]